MYRNEVVEKKKTGAQARMGAKQRRIIPSVFNRTSQNKRGWRLDLVDLKSKFLAGRKNEFWNVRAHEETL